MRKFVSGLAILLALSLMTCEMAPLGGVGEEETSAYQFDAAGNLRAITATFKNGELTFPADNNNSRALNQPITEGTYDTIEVVFFDGITTARTTFTRGTGGRLKNVPRGEVGVGIDYESVDPDEADGVAGTKDIAEFGAAAIFIGTNGTLQAIGKIIKVDGIDGTVVKNTTNSVTFGVTALVSDMTQFVIPVVTWDHDGDGGTTPEIPMVWKVPTTINNETPAGYYSYFLKPDETYDATYTIKTSSTSTPPLVLSGEDTHTSPVEVVSLLPAIRVINETAGIRPLVKTLNPQQKLVQGEMKVPARNNFEVKGVFSGDIYSLTTGDALADDVAYDSDAANAPENKPWLEIDFEITTPSTTEAGITSLYFEIPVNAINSESSSDGSSASDPYPWYIRPGYDYMYLDIGAYGTGGSIFIVVYPQIDKIKATSKYDFSSGMGILTE